MKLVDKMKDERLGIAILYNFSKGYEKPVPMELYDIVLPFIYHDAFRKEILKHETLKDVIEASIEADPHFKEVILFLIIHIQYILILQLVAVIVSLILYIK